jgi:hypothetical protein
VRHIMKHPGSELCLIFAFLCLLTGLGCKHKGSDSSSETRAPVAPLGNPTGPATTGTIGPGGGVLNSADGRISIEVPPGSVAGNTPFAIQPLSTTEPGGIGPVYVLSPEGLRFAQPVTLAWHLSDSDLAGHPIQAVSIATRDAEGNWIPQPGVERDPAAKTVRVTSIHLSPWWTIVPELTITPDHTQVGVRNTVDLTVSRSTSNDNDSDLLAAPHNTGTGQQNGDQDGGLLTPPPKADCTWKVNGTVGGNSASGTVSGKGKYTATYTSPAKVPRANPVAVSCEETMMANGKKAKIIAVSYITVTDKKVWRGTFQYEYSDTSQSGTPPTTSIHEEVRHVAGSIDLEADSQGFGMVGGQGNATLEQTITGTITNPMCTFKDVNSLSGPLQVDAHGAVGSGAGSLSLEVHGDNLTGGLEHDGGKCSQNGSGTSIPVSNGSFSVSCQFIGVDYDKGGSYKSPWISTEDMAFAR